MTNGGVAFWRGETEKRFKALADAFAHLKFAVDSKKAERLEAEKVEQAKRDEEFRQAYGNVHYGKGETMSNNSDKIENFSDPKTAFLFTLNSDMEKIYTALLTSPAEAGNMMLAFILRL